MMHALRILAPLMAIAATPGPDVEVSRLDADPLRGRLAALDDRSLALETPSGVQTLDLSAVLAIAFPAGTGAAADVGVYAATAEGSQLLARQVTCNGEVAEVIRLDGATIALPRDALVSLRFRALDDALLAEFQKAVESTDVSDRVIVEREGTLDFLEGVVEQVGPDSVRFRLEEELRELPRARLTGVAFHRRAGGPEPVILGRLVDRQGAVAAFAKISATEQGLRVAASTGWSADWAWADVRRLDFSTGKLLALTDLAAERSEFAPEALWNLPGAGETLREAFAPRFDRGFDPGPLLLGGRSYARGIALRPRSRLAYRLPEGYRRFTATVGIDDRAGPHGDAVLTIRGDEHTLSKSRLTAGAGPESIDVTIADHHRLTILVEAGQHGDVGDVVLLVNPRLSK